MIVVDILFILLCIGSIYNSYNNGITIVFFYLAIFTSSYVSYKFGSLLSIFLIKNKYILYNSDFTYYFIFVLLFIFVFIFVVLIGNNIKILFSKFFILRIFDNILGLLWGLLKCLVVLMLIYFITKNISNSLLVWKISFLEDYLGGSILFKLIHKLTQMFNLYILSIFNMNIKL